MIGTYSASRSFEWNHSYYKAEWAIDSLPREMNQMLGEVVQEIRNGMVSDREKLEE